MMPLTGFSTEPIMNSKLSRYGNKRMLLFLLFFAFGIFLLWYFFHPLSPHNVRVRYVAAFDKIGPVSGGKNVKVGGIPKGRITHIEKTDSLLYVNFEVESSVRIPKDSRLHFASAGFLGNRELEIVLGDSSESFSNGDTIFCTVFDKGLETAREDLGESVSRLKTILDSARAFFDAFDSGAEGRQIRRMTQKGKRISSVSASSLESLGNELERFLDDLSTSAKKLDAVSAEISAGMYSSRESFSETLERLDSLRESVRLLDARVSGVIEKLDRNDNSAALVLQKGSAVSSALKSVQTNVDILVRDVKTNGVKLNVDFF